MFDIVGYLQNLIESEVGKLYYIIFLYIILSIFDFIIGTYRAKTDNATEFTSFKLKSGIAYKIILIILIILFLFVAVLFKDVGIPAYFVLIIGLIFSEIYSILGHLDINKDSKAGKFIIEFLEKLFKDDGGKENEK